MLWEFVADGETSRRGNASDLLNQESMRTGTPAWTGQALCSYWCLGQQNELTTERSGQADIPQTYGSLNLFQWLNLPGLFLLFSAGHGGQQTWEQEVESLLWNGRCGGEIHQNIRKVYQFSHQTYLAQKPHSWPSPTGCSACKKIKIWQMHKFLEYCFPLGLYGTLTSRARTCTHITLNNSLCCDLVVTSWRCLNSPTPCCKDSQELCEERTDGALAERQGALGRGAGGHLSWLGKDALSRGWGDGGCLVQADRTGSKEAEGDEEVTGRALVWGRSQKPVRLTVTSRQEKYRVLVKAPKSMKLGFIAD